MRNSTLVLTGNEWLRSCNWKRYCKNIMSKSIENKSVTELWYSLKLFNFLSIISKFKLCWLLFYSCQAQWEGSRAAFCLFPVTSGERGSETFRTPTNHILHYTKQVFLLIWENKRYLCFLYAEFYKLLEQNVLKINRTVSIIGILAASPLFQFVYVLKEGLCDLLGHKMIVNIKNKEKRHWIPLSLSCSWGRWVTISCRGDLITQGCAKVQLIFLNIAGFTVLNSSKCVALWWTGRLPSVFPLLLLRVCLQISNHMELSKWIKKSFKHVWKARPRECKTLQLCPFALLLNFT